MISPLVIKLGGILLESDNAMMGLFKAIYDYQKLNQRNILIIHGGGRLIDDLMNKLSFPIKKKMDYELLLLNILILLLVL